MERYYQPEIECASPEQIKAWQDERLVNQVKNVWENVPYYRKKMEEKGIRPLSASRSSSPAVQTAAWTRCAICSVRSLDTPQRGRLLHFPVFRGKM